MIEEEKIEKVARQLCMAAGKNPDARIRLGAPLSFTAGECTVIRPLIVPEWKQYYREARRLAMSDAEHEDLNTSERPGAARSLLRQTLHTLSAASVRCAGRPDTAQFAARLRALCTAVEIGALTRAKEAGAHIW